MVRRFRCIGSGTSLVKTVFDLPLLVRADRFDNSTPVYEMVSYCWNGWSVHVRMTGRGDMQQTVSFETKIAESIIDRPDGLAH